MRRRFQATLTPIFLFATFLQGCSPAAEDSAASRDASEPLRIVTLSPHLAELVFAVGAGELLVGVSAYTDYPEAAKQKPVIGDAFVVDQERLAVLRPDLLLAWQSGTPAHVVDELRQRGYRVETIRTRGLSDVAGALERIGELTGRREKAAQAAAAFTDGIERLSAPYRDAAPIRVFYQVQKRPVYTINGQHYVSELIGNCGGENIFSDLNDLAPLVAVEAVLDRDPEVLMASTDAPEQPFGEWQRWPGMSANRYGNHFLMPADEIGRATPRLLVAGEAICHALDDARANRAREENE